MAKLTILDINKLKYFNRQTLIALLNSYQLHKKRVALERIKFGKNKIGGTQKDTRFFIKTLLKADLEATKELGFSLTENQNE